jgi:CheY-like chemotaxis protein
LEHLLPEAKDARILWIDDRPEKVIGERRLLRALGVNVVPAVSSERAKQVLHEDGDFDLIISDVQRAGDTYKLTGGVEIHEGVNFVCWLRHEHPDKTARALPVIFYAAYDWDRLLKFTRAARECHPEPGISNSVLDLVPKILVSLAESRAMPIKAPEVKAPTRLKKTPNSATPADQKAPPPDR